MAKDHIPDFDTTAGNNTDLDGIDISEGCAPSGINNAIREVMADLANAIQVRSISSATTLGTSDHGKVIECDASSGAFTVTLPAVGSNTGMTVVVKKTDSSTNAVTVDGNSTEKIDGSTTYALNTQYESVMVRSDGTEWWVVTAYDPAPGASKGFAIAMSLIF
jgi:hypothetical protein